MDYTTLLEILNGQFRTQVVGQLPKQGGVRTVNFLIGRYGRVIMGRSSQYLFSLSLNFFMNNKCIKLDCVHYTVKVIYFI